MEILIVFGLLYVLGFITCLLFAAWLEAGYTSLDAWDRDDIAGTLGVFIYIPILNVIVPIIFAVVVMAKTLGGGIKDRVDDLISDIAEKIKRK